MHDIPPSARKRTTMVTTEAAIDGDGNLTHLRFTSLSTLDVVNRAAFRLVTQQHYRPTVSEGKRVPVCSTGTVNVDLSY
ncbi:MAG TPA: hypothetical protein VKU19_35575 [Bryobacteraceae bacterium]|nr:hypothetical protein [Bryobacteraceae bacterium]